MRSFADTELMYLKGVGEKRAKLLADELDLHTFRDLLHYFPFRHIDRSRFYKIRELTGEMPLVQIRGRFISFQIEGEGAKKRLLGLFTDGDRLMQTVWFSRVNALRDAYRTGTEYVLFGKPTPYRGSFNMVHPEVSAYNPDNPPKGFEGVYNITDRIRKAGYSPKLLSGLLRNLLSHPGFADLPETLPQEVVDEFRLMPLKEALSNIHFPENANLLQKARERMKFEELFYLQMHILRFSRARSHKIRGLVFARIGEHFNRFYSECLPFELTGAQKRVLREIREDMRTGRQMNRLLQGDVGSGKTMVAFMSMLMACDNGHQSALMAPTEILATQHTDRSQRQTPHRQHPRKREERDTRRTSRRIGRPDRGDSRPDRGHGAFTQSRAGADRRAAPVRRRTVGKDVGKKRYTAPCARHDRHTDTAHFGNDRLR